MYRVGFSTETTNNAKNKAVNVEFLVDNIVIHEHSNGSDLLQYAPDDMNSWMTLSEVYYLNITSARTVVLNMTFSAVQNAARISNSVIEIWRVS